jgi:predicted RNA binding protein YcfA (HicA-like mRNA interferase family)
MRGKELVKLLEKNGWTLDRIKGSHHIMFKENKTLSVPVHDNKDLGKGLLNRLLKEGGLKK